MQHIPVVDNEHIPRPPMYGGEVHFHRAVREQAGARLAVRACGTMQASSNLMKGRAGLQMVE